MPKTGALNVQHNLDEGMRIAQELQGELPKSAQEASRVIASAYIREATTVMQRQGNVGTGQGLQSLNVQSIGKKGAGVYGADYLLDLHSGTDAHWPDISNSRFISWARMHGFDRYELAQIIARKGTRAHPWMMQAFSQTYKTSDDRLKVSVDRTVQRVANR